MARGAVKVVSINGALTVTFTAASGATPTAFSDEACTTTVSLPATVADGANTTFYFASPGSYTLSVKTSGGIQIAGDLNSTKVVTVAAGDVGVYSYDTRLVARDASGDSGRHSPNTDLSAAYVAPSFFVRAYGGKGDGTTDDAAAVAAAVAACNAAGGGEVVFDAGTWLIGSAQNSAPVDSLGHNRALLYFTGLAKVRLRGLGGKALIKATTATGPTILEVRDSSDVEVIGLAFQNNNATNIASDNNSNVSGSAIRFTNVARGLIRSNDITACGYSAVYLTGGSKNVTVDDNYLHELGASGNNANGINEDALNGTNGGASAPCSGNSIINNRLVNVRGSGAICLDNSGAKTQTLVAHNTVDNPLTAYSTANFQGIRCHDIFSVQIIGNTIKNCLREGIFVDSTGPALGSIVIEGNIVDTCGTGGYDGIRLDTLSNGEMRGFGINDNLIRNCGGCGINLVSPSTNLVRDGVVTGNVIVDNDTFSAGTSDGIRVQGRRVAVLGNSVVGTTTAHRYGLRVETGSTLVYAPYNTFIGTVTGTVNDATSSITHYWDTENQAVLSFGSGWAVKAGAAGTITQRVINTTPSADMTQWIDGSTVKARIGSDFGIRSTNSFKVETSAGGAVQWQVDSNGVMKNGNSSNESTGAGSAALGANCPAVTTTAPYKWLKLTTSDGSTVFLPVWK